MPLGFAWPNYVCFMAYANTLYGVWRVLFSVPMVYWELLFSQTKRKIYGEVAGIANPSPLSLVGQFYPKKGHFCHFAGRKSPLLLNRMVKRNSHESYYNPSCRYFEIHLWYTCARLCYIKISSMSKKYIKISSMSKKYNRRKLLYHFLSIHVYCQISIVLYIFSLDTCSLSNCDCPVQIEVMLQIITCMPSVFWYSGQLSRHYITEISLNMTLNDNQPTNHRQPREMSHPMRLKTLRGKKFFFN